jgi:hypothetical protein
MRYIKYLVVLILVFASCKTKKYALDADVIAKEISAKKVIRRHISSSFNKKTLEAKFKVNFRNTKFKQSISVQLKIKKDEVIWLKGTKFINVFKAKITPQNIRFYSPLEKTYFEGDFSMLEKLLGTEINFEQLQNLFLGQAILDIKQKNQQVEIVNNSYVLSPEIQAKLFDAFFAVNPIHFKLDYQSIGNSIKSKQLDIKYPSYKLIEDEIFPQEIKIKAVQDKNFTTIDFFLNTVEFNNELNTSFTIPKGYKRINI